MKEQLQADSELAAASWLRDPLNSDPVDPLAEWFRVHAEIAAAAQPIRLPQLLGKLDGLYPDEWTEEPQLLEYRDVLWLPRGAVCLRAPAAGHYPERRSAVSPASVNCRLRSAIGSN